MEENEMLVVDDMVVSLAYQLRLEDGMEVDKMDPDSPLMYLHGNGQIIPGLESALYGMSVGEEKTVILGPAEGYGEEESNELLEVARDDFPPDYPLVSGKPLRVADENTGKEFTAYIKDIEGDSVTLDMNHPLAGETLHFDVCIVAIRKASEQELSHGHVHLSDDEDHSG